jgi:CDP-2,3-bis-(O-geranylgeranyl)-sn-glycerol synthase
MLSLEVRSAWRRGDSLSELPLGAIAALAEAERIKSMTIRDALFVIWFFLPAGLANMTPIFAAQLPYIRRWSFPLDGYATFRGKRVFGSHKTIRGVLSGMLIGILTVYLQVYVYAHVAFVRTFVLLDYTAIQPLLFGVLASGGALMGDAIRSFFKRQLGIAPGKSWFPFDQLDYVIGGIALTAVYVQLTFWQYLLLCLIWFLLHPLATFIGFVLKLKDSPI